MQSRRFVGWGAGMVFALLAPAHPAFSTAWTVEGPVAVLDGGGQVVGTAQPATVAEIEGDLGFGPLEDIFLFGSTGPGKNVRSDDLVFFSFVAQGTFPTGGSSGLGLSFTGTGVPSATGAGWILEAPDDPATVEPDDDFFCGQGRCFTFEAPLLLDGQESAILWVSFDVGEVAMQIADNPTAELALRFQNGAIAATPFTPEPLTNPSVAIAAFEGVAAPGEAVISSLYTEAGLEFRHRNSFQFQILSATFPGPTFSNGTDFGYVQNPPGIEISGEGGVAFDLLRFEIAQAFGGFGDITVTGTPADGGPEVERIEFAVSDFAQVVELNSQWNDLERVEITSTVNFLAIDNVAAATAAPEPGRLALALALVGALALVSRRRPSGEGARP